ncbi:hypothetical protein AVEN_151657-1 [Araneus ventricosus]|uniref:Uncharacterized protein n=1 Tax=Araneus ventricosus TaxID=182803 RepID=A0A4Y2JVM6_ARAVE|nr:hypothetical protein AVEN_151657-1 [Araneus ventricosus]
MNKKRYYFNELSENFALRCLAQKAKATLQYNETLVKMYQNYNHVLYGQSPKLFIDLVKLNTRSIVSNCQRGSCTSPKQSRTSTSPETTNQATSTPVKKIPNVSTLQRKYLSFDDAGNVASQNVTTSQEKQLTPMKMNRNAKEPDILQHENLSLISSDKGESRIVSSNRRKQLTPMKVNPNAKEAENFPHKRSPLGYKEMEKAEAVNLEPHTPVKRQKAIVSPKKMERTIVNSITQVDRKYVTPNAQDPETAGNPESDKREPERSVEAVKKSAVSTLKIKENPSPYKEVGVEDVPTTDDGKNTSPEGTAIASDNQKSISTAEETTQIVQTSKDGRNYFSPVKEVKVSVSPVTNAQESVCSDDKVKILVRSVQDRKMNVSPNQGSNLSKSFEGKRKLPSPRTDNALCSSMPRIIQSSGAVEIEIDISCLSVENPSPTTSPVSLLGYKIMKTVTDENIDKERSPKDVNLSITESKPGCSRDSSPSTRSSVTSSPPVVANTNSPIRDMIGLGKYNLSYKPSKGSPPTSISSATLSPPRIKNMDTNTLVYCITQLKTLIAKRDACMRPIYYSLKGIGTNLVYLNTHIQYIVQIMQNIPIVNKGYVNEDLTKNIFGLITLASQFIKKLGSVKKDVQLDIDFWTECFEQIRKIRSQNEPLMSNGKILVTIKDLHTFEEELKEKWDSLDDTIPAVESRRSLFLTTADDLEKCINLFVKSLITVGVLKPSSTPVL